MALKFLTIQAGATGKQALPRAAGRQSGQASPYLAREAL